MNNLGNKPPLKFSAIKSCLLWCAGVDSELLATCQKSVVIKYSALGGLVLTPAILAVPSMSFFMLTILPKTPWAVYMAGGIGIMWGGIILNIDRFLVMTLNKSGSAMKDFFSFATLSRTAISGVFAFTIAHPLLLAMFGGNLIESINHNKMQQRDAIKAVYEQKYKAFDQDIAELMTKNNVQPSLDGLTEDTSAARELKSKIADKQKEIDEAEREFSDEIAVGVKSKTGLRGYGPTAISIESRIKTLKAQLGNLNTELKQIQDTQAKNVQLKRQMLADEATNLEAMRQANRASITEKLQAQAQLKADKEEALKSFDNHLSLDFLTLSNELDALSAKNPNVWMWEWLLMALFFTIDMVALLLKVLVDKDSYDEKKQTNAFLEMETEQARKKAYENKQPEFVKLEEDSVQVELTQQRFTMIAQANLTMLQLLTDYIDQHHVKTNQFQSTYKQYIKPNDKSSQAVIDDYMDIAAKIFANTLNEMRNAI